MVVRMRLCYNRSFAFTMAAKSFTKGSEKLYLFNASTLLGIWIFTGYEASPCCNDSSYICLEDGGIKRTCSIFQRVWIKAEGDAFLFQFLSCFLFFVCAGNTSKGDEIGLRPSATTHARQRFATHAFSPKVLSNMLVSPKNQKNSVIRGKIINTLYFSSVSRMTKIFQNHHHTRAIAYANNPNEILLSLT